MPDPDTFIATCPSCGQARHAPSQYAGRRVHCKCGESFVLVPPLSEPPQLSPQEAVIQNRSNNVADDESPPGLRFLGFPLCDLVDGSSEFGPTIEERVLTGRYRSLAIIATYQKWLGWLAVGLAVLCDALVIGSVWLAIGRGEFSVLLSVGAAVMIIGQSLSGCIVAISVWSYSQMIALAIDCEEHLRHSRDRLNQLAETELGD